MKNSSVILLEAEPWGHIIRTDRFDYIIKEQRVYDGGRLMTTGRIQIHLTNWIEYVL